MPVITNNSGPAVMTTAADIDNPPSPDVLRSIHLTGADGIRAVACLWVMLAHLFMELPNAFQLTAQPWVLVYRGHAGVGIFFVLSGFLLSQPFWKAFLAGTALPNLRVYWSRRLARIVPGYWCCVLITAAASGMLSTRWDISALLLTLFFLNSALAATYAPAFNPPLWSISVEMWFYLFLPLTMMVMFRFRTVRRAIGFILGLMATLVVAQWLFLLAAPWIETTVNDKSWFSTSESAWATHQNPPAMFAHFLFGVLAGWGLQALERSGCAPHRTRANWCDVGALTVMLLLIFILMYGDHLPIFLHYMRYSWPVFPLTTGLLLVMLPFSRIVGKMVDNRFFRWTALVSYGLYIWHVPIFRCCKSILPLQENDPIWLAVAFFAVALVATYAVATASYLIIERPVVRWAKRREAQHASKNGSLAEASTYGK